MKMIVLEPAGEDMSNEKNGTLRSFTDERAYDPLITGVRVQRICPSITGWYLFWQY